MELSREGGAASKEARSKGAGSCAKGATGGDGEGGRGAARGHRWQVPQCQGGVLRSHAGTQTL
jgi:hypothetical protein